MEKIKKLIALFVSPITIGIFITLLMVYTAFKYYEFRGENRAYVHGIYQVLTWIDQKSNDFRLLIRGEREGSDRVAVLTIDDRAVEEIGRWPWSRDKIAHVIDKMVEYGASVVAFDIIFSEKDKNQTLSALNEIQKTNPTLPLTQKVLSEQLLRADTDRFLVASVKKNASHLVMGTYFDPPEYGAYPYQEICINRAYVQTRAYKYWDKEPLLIVSDENDAELPPVLGQILDQVFAAIAQEETTHMLPEFKVTSVDQLEFNKKQILETQILNQQVKYCLSWLSKEDPNYEVYQQAWPEIQKSNKALANLSFEDGINAYKYSFLANAVTPVGRWWMSFPELADATETSGFFLADLDSDGVIRKSPLFVRSGNQYAPSISLRSFLIDRSYQAQIFLKPNPKLPSEKIVSEMIVADGEGNPVFQIPVDSKGRLIINYAGRRSMFPYLSAAELFNDSPTAKIQKRVYDPQTKMFLQKDLEVDKKEFIKNKIFVFGATSTGIYDLRVTPFEENFPGVETHANVLDNLFRQDFLRPHPAEEMSMVLVILALGIILSITLSKLGAVWGLLVTIITLTTMFYIDRYYLFKAGYVVTVFFPVLLTIVIYVFLTFYKYFTEERKKRELKGTFAKYVSPAIVDEILSDPTKIELGGRKEKLTVLFSDIRGFTTISEKLDPRALSDLLNSYLTPMTRLVFEYKGTLDKYMGDAIMAFWGAPIHFPDHAKHACRCALTMLSRLKELQSEYQKKGLPMIDIGIGLNTGEMSVGNMGSDIVRSYTVMGDSVNLGSRLEGINKQYGTRIIISEFTYEEVKDDFIAREVDWVRVKGKALPVRIYELIAEKTTSEQTMEMIKYFNSGFDLYHKREFQKAIECFTNALNVQPADQCSKLYLERCHNYLEEQPPENWDGVFTMKTK